MKSLVTLFFLAWVSFSHSLRPNTLFGVISRASSHTEELPDLYEASISELQLGLEQGKFTSVDLVKVHYHL